MNGSNFLLDTNIVLYILSGNVDLADFLNGKRLYISVITEMELLSYPSLSPNEVQKIKSFISELITLPINDKIKEETIRIRRKNKIKLPDSIIIATSIVYNLPLVTADKQFKTIKEIQLLLYEA